MTTVRATCPDCGDVELTTRAMTVRICSHDDSGAYRFRCPICEMAVLRAAEDHVVDLLAASGVEVVVWDLPAELDERPRDGGRLTHDDLLDFHDRLEDDESWVKELLGTVED